MNGVAAFYSTIWKSRCKCQSPSCKTRENLEPTVATNCTRCICQMYSRCLRKKWDAPNESKSSVAHSRSPRYEVAHSWQLNPRKPNHHDSQPWQLQLGSSFSSGHLHKKLKPPGSKWPTRGISWTSPTLHGLSRFWGQNWPDNLGQWWLMGMVSTC